MQIPSSTRPRLPKEYGILEEKKDSGLLPWSRVDDSVGSARNYWIHTTRSDGRPHVEPVWGIWVNGHLYFSTSPKSVSGLNLSARNSIAVHLESGDDVVILKGKAEPVTDRELLSRLDEAYFAKYAYHLPAEDGSVYSLGHRVVFSWVEQDFVGSATKYVFQT